ncbi:MAG: SLAC1 anion channel family protein [Pseudomonadota bacterium]
METAIHSRLARFPVTFFTMIMGLSGFTLSLAKAEEVLGWSSNASSVSLAITTGLFVLVTVAYLLKILQQWEAVRDEWSDPIRVAFFPAFSISLLLLAVAFYPNSVMFAEAVWLVGAVLQLLLTVGVVTSWIGARSFQHGHLTPAWFVPVVGNVIAPIGGVMLGYVEFSWFLYAIGLMFWIVLLAIVINRLIFHDPIPERLQPTLVVLIAPPAIGFLGWTSLNEGLDPFARILINVGYFFCLVVMVQLPALSRLQFSMTFWALSFPLAAITTASLRFAELSGSAFHSTIGFGLLGVLVVILTWLVVRTVQSVWRGEVF